MNNIQLTSLPTHSRLVRQLVTRNGTEIGLLEKYPSSRSERHPWKAFRGIGDACKYVGAFYPEDGGKQAALAAVTA